MSSTNLSGGSDLASVREEIATILRLLEKVPGIGAPKAREDETPEEALRQVVAVNECWQGFTPCNDAEMKKLGLKCPEPGPKELTIFVDKDNNRCVSNEVMARVFGLDLSKQGTTVASLLAFLADDISKEMTEMSRTNPKLATDALLKFASGTGSAGP